MFKNKEQEKTMSKTNNSKFDTMLGHNTKITGDVEFSGVLHIDGGITGNIKAAGTDDILTISESGRIEGKIEVSNIVINGTVNGDIISSNKIEVASKADIQGNVYYKNIEMDAGSRVNGQLFYQDGDSNIKPIKENSK